MQYNKPMELLVINGANLNMLGKENQRFMAH